MEMAKFDNDQITKELKKGFWLGVMADGPLMPEVQNFVGCNFEKNISQFFLFFSSLLFFSFFFLFTAQKYSSGLLRHLAE